MSFERKTFFISTNSTCAQEKAKDAFSTTQWQMPEKTGSQCISCSDRKVRERREAFAAANQTAPTSADADSGSTPAWPQDASKADCERYILGAPELALPSVCTKTCQAMYGLKGRKNWHTVAPKLDTSGISAQQKLGYLRAAHTDLSHFGGRDGIVSALKQSGIVWPLIPLDAQFLVDRCDQCRLNTSRDGVCAQPRHLPTPHQAGEVIGWDLKSIVPSKPKKWIMLLAVCFTSHKVWAWDLDPKQASLKNVQNIMLRFFAEHELPAVTWTDNGGQFATVIGQALYNAIGVQPRTIPPGRPQSNGLTEKYNHLLDLTHRGNRAELLAAVIALNQRPLPGLDHSPEQLWRLLRPATSRWQAVHVRKELHGEKPILSDQEWLNFLDAQPLDKEDLRKKAAALADKLLPIKRAIDHKKLRAKMQRQLKWTRRSKQKSQMALLSGDRVVSRTTQYVSRTQPIKYETRGDTVREFTVLHVAQGFVQIQDDQTGEILWKHESFLKAMPRALPPDDQNMPTPCKRCPALLQLAMLPT